MLTVSRATSAQRSLTVPTTLLTDVAIAKSALLRPCVQSAISLFIFRQSVWATIAFTHNASLVTLVMCHWAPSIPMVVSAYVRTVCPSCTAPGARGSSLIRRCDWMTKSRFILNVFVALHAARSSQIVIFLALATSCFAPTHACRRLQNLKISSRRLQDLKTSSLRPSSSRLQGLKISSLRLQLLLFRQQRLQFRRACYSDPQAKEHHRRYQLVLAYHPQYQLVAGTSHRRKGHQPRLRLPTVLVSDVAAQTVPW